MLTGDFETHKHHIYEAGKVKVLKAAAIYGANGAGKSNLVRAIGCLQGWVQEGEIKTSVNSQKFKLDSSYQEKPVRFEIEFHTNGKLYAYGISVDGTAVQEEWLYEVGVTKKDRLVFERTVDSSNQTKLVFAKEYQKTKKQQLLIELMQDNLLKKEQLLLGKHEELKIDEMKAAYSWINWQIGVREATSSDHHLMWLSTSEGGRLFASELLRSLDTGADNIQIEEDELENALNIDSQQKQKAIRAINGKERTIIQISTDNGPAYIIYRDGRYIVQTPVLDHNGVPFYLSEESDGTRKLLSYASSVHTLTHLSFPRTYIFDEIEQSIHPSLLKKLLKKIMSDKTTHGQLIFTTHESNLLDLNIFRQDEIWFAEKERETGATQFYSLSEFKPNYGSDIEKGYLNGRFGAIPFLGNLESLNWHQHAEKE